MLISSIAQKASGVVFLVGWLKIPKLERILKVLNNE